MDYKSFLSNAVSVVPSKRQKKWFDTEFYAFVHFTVNTYTGLEWGNGDEDPKIFDPYDLDCDEWVKAVKSAGMKGIVLTAKHHDGFCLWQTETTEHSVKNSNWKNGKGDVVRECAEACRRGGIGFGIYLSPWDRNSKYYGTDKYNDIYAAQLTELLTGYGELFIVWQDNACGEGENGKKQVYDFERFNALIRKYQPGAVIFNDFGPDVRWCGNEAGKARPSEWSVVPSELCYRAENQTSGALVDGSLDGMYCTDKDIGVLSNIQYSKGLVFAPSEFDMSIRKGWFYHENEEPHSLDRLFETYISTVGHNACLNLNIPPMPSGRFDPRDIKRLSELGEKLRKEFGEPTKAEFKKVYEEECGKCVYEASFSNRDVSYVVLSEDLEKGQRIESFKVRRSRCDQFALYCGLTVGNKQICPMPKSPRAKGLDKLYIEITSTRGEVFLKDIVLY